MSTGYLIRAAQYVRMSTEDQEFSIANQMAAIQKYATQHGFLIVRTYRDAGKSGMMIRNRRGLSALLQDAMTGAADYKAVLVYDVSRWGRFRNPDEAAHYEFICKAAGISVHYCAEQFSNDGSFTDSILKIMKRSMAAEYSRELGVKVFEGQRQIALRGFRVSGGSPYGLRRIAVSVNGNRRRILHAGERKSVTTDRVILAPGSKHQIRCVRNIFLMAVRGKKTPKEIALELNRTRIQYVAGKKWSAQAVWRLLRNPAYAGYNVWRRTTGRMGVRTRKLTREHWVVKSKAFVPIVDESTFQRAQKLLSERKLHPKRPDQELLDELSRLLALKGELNTRIIDRARGVFDAKTYAKRFGSLLEAYRQIGYQPALRILKSTEHGLGTHSLRRRLLARLCDLFPGNLRVIKVPGLARQVVEVDRQFRVSIFLCREFLTVGGRRRWMFRIWPRERTNVAFVCIVDSGFSKINDYYVLPPVLDSVAVYKQLHENDPWLATGHKLTSLAEFYAVAKEYGKSEL